MPGHERPVVSLSVSRPVPTPSRPAVGVSDEGPKANPVIVVAPSLPKDIRELDAGSEGSNSGRWMACPRMVPSIGMLPAMSDVPL